MISTDLIAQHFPTNLGILLKQAPLPSTAAGVIEKIKPFYVLALTDADTRDRKNGKECPARFL